MIPRTLSKKLEQTAKKFPVVAITGPRQSGKTTLAKSVFPSKPYVSLETPDVRDFALTDPRQFLSRYPKGAVLDEIQRAPHLFSYIQDIVDQNRKAGFFILTGSQNFLLLESLSQTLAGRVNILKLLPLSMEEMASASIPFKSPEELLFSGFYPRIYDKRIAPREWYPVYIQTYLERDVRQIKNIGDLNAFQRFLKFCAAQTGQLLNLSSLANDCGITHNTARSWIGILEASFIIYLLQPYHKNFRKRLIKTPKLYFYDTGLVCSLLGIENKKQLETHPIRGSLFEAMILSEFFKHRYNRGLPSNFYFWRDKTGREVDCLIEKASKIILVEIKSGQTVSSDSFKNLTYLEGLSGKPGNSFLIYAGEDIQKRKSATVIGWKSLNFLTNLNS